MPISTQARKLRATSNLPKGKGLCLLDYVQAGMGRPAPSLFESTVMVTIKHNDSEAIASEVDTILAPFVMRHQTVYL